MSGDSPTSAIRTGEVSARRIPYQRADREGGKGMTKGRKGERIQSSSSLRGAVNGRNWGGDGRVLLHEKGEISKIWEKGKLR